MTRSIDCAHVIGPSGPMAGAQTIAIDGGNIAAVAPAAVAGRHLLLAIPALVNAHDHGRAVRTGSIGADAKPLETWLHYLSLFPSVDPYLSAAMAFSNSALGGAGTVMVHYTRPQGFTDLPTEVAEVARAARDVGVRAGFAVSMKDRNPLVYGLSEPILAALPTEQRAEIEQRFIRPPLAPGDYIKLVEDVAASSAAPGFDVQYGPNGVQWCSDALLRAVADASALTGRRVHMHLLETRYQRLWADAQYPQGIVRMLDEIGLLSPRLTLAHCVWARPDEYELLAERGVTIAVSTSSNLHLHSGIAPMNAMNKAGCTLALGIDSKALDDDDDCLRELRLAYLIHAGIGFDINSRNDALHAAVRNGRFSVNNIRDAGAIVAGAEADLLLLDWAALDDDNLMSNLNPVNILFARATSRHIRELIVGGRSVTRDQRVLGVDLPAIRQEILAQMRTGLGKTGALAKALTELDGSIKQHYASDTHCC